ncbi:hypothetical protein AB1N83_013234 [Pleurotus pulmonarius]
MGGMRCKGMGLTEKWNANDDGTVSERHTIPPWSPWPARCMNEGRTERLRRQSCRGELDGGSERQYTKEEDEDKGGKVAVDTRRTMDDGGTETVFAAGCRAYSARAILDDSP